MAVTLRDNYSGTATPYFALTLNASTDWAFQSFTTTQGYSLSRIDFWMAKNVGGSIGTLTVELYASDGSGEPTGGLLATGTIANADVGDTSSYSWVLCTLTSSYNLLPSTKYIIILRGASLNGANYIIWSYDDDGIGASDFAGGDQGWSTDSGSNWSIDTTQDQLFRCYGDTTPPTDKTYTKKLVAIGNHELWQESVAGTMSELTAANSDFNTSNKLNAVVAFQKLFIANESALKIADFVNAKIATADVGSNPPHRDIILTGGSSGAKMVVDYITSTSSACTIYGKRTTTATFTAGETVTGTNPSTSPYGTSVSFVMTGVAEVAAPHWYDWTVYGTDATNYGAMPAKAYLVCNFMGCLMLSGDPNYPHQWYMSRQLNPFDWLYAQDDAQSAVAGNDADAGEVGDIIKVNIPYKDDYVVHACANTLWYMTGHPCAGGTIVELDLTTGILGDRAYCWDDKGNLYMMCTVGLLRVPPGFGPLENLTIELWPNFIADLAFDASLHRITLAFNPEDRGVHIFKTTLSNGTSSAWWYDLRVEGLFPDSYSTDHGAFSSVYYQSEDPSYRKLLIGCNDGYIRFLDKTTKNDDSTAIDSYVGFAPLGLSTSIRKDGIIENIDVVTGGGESSGSLSDSDDILCSVHVARTAAKIIEKLDGGTAAKFTKTFSGPGWSRNNMDRRSARGQWGGIVLSNNTAGESWSIERLILDTREVGRSI
ncbi:hypothetical protein LCGC14_0577880 [marine sediment metagenome]|uniref:Uncharacterized protein n=1 Tax=marine sediment metagenome TaxID=412755 RepID=A0A0F9S0Y0_9ZZZZ